ncbi:MAG: hypothetical protein RL698_2280 [Pseudomonadota bacterium]
MDGEDQPAFGSDGGGDRRERTDRAAVGAASGLSESGRDVLCLAGAALALLLYWFLGVNGRVHDVVDFAGSDLPFQFLPDYAYLATRMRAGQLALWNPWQGQPFLATLLPGTLYPARLLLIALEPATAMHVSTVAHLLASFVATFALARALRVGRAASLLAGIVYMGIYALPQVYWSSFLEGGAWLPVAGLALVRMAETGAWRWSIALGASVGLVVLAGCYQHALYAVYGLVVLYLALLADPSRRGCLLRPDGLLRLAVAGLLAAATAAPQALPTLAWSAQSVRSGIPLTDDQLDLWPLPDYILAAMFPPWGSASPIIVSLPVVLLGLVGCLSTGWFGAVLLVATATTMAMCLGRGFPAYALFHVLPGFSSFRQPERLVFLVGFFAAIATALGADRLARGGRIERGLALVGAAAIAASLLGPVRLSSALPWTMPRNRLAGPPRLFSIVARESAGGRTLLTGSGSEDGIAVKQAGMNGVRALQDYNPLSSRRLAGYLHGLVGEPTPKPEDPDMFAGSIPMTQSIVQPGMLDMASVRTLLLRATASMPVREPPFRALGTRGRWTLWNNPGAFPRAYLVERARFVADDDAALEVVRTPDFPARDEVVLVGEASGPERAGLVDGPPGTMRAARIALDAPEHVVVEASSEHPAVVVLTDPFAPGWTATIDGRAAAVLAANHLGRGVVVPPGRHRVEFRYAAPGLRTGVVAFSLGWASVALAAAAARWWRPRRNRERARAPDAAAAGPS